MINSSAEKFELSREKIESSLTPIEKLVEEIYRVSKKVVEISEAPVVSKIKEEIAGENARSTSDASASIEELTDSPKASHSEVLQAKKLRDGIIEWRW